MRRFLLLLALLAVACPAPAYAQGYPGAAYPERGGEGGSVTAQATCNQVATRPEVCQGDAVEITSIGQLATAVSTAVRPTHVHIPNDLTYTSTADPSIGGDATLFDFQLNATQVPVTLNSTTDTFTATDHDFSAGDGPFRLDADTTVPGNTVSEDFYFISENGLTADEFQLVGPNSNGSLNADPVDFSSDGSGVWVAPIPNILLTCAPGVELAWNHTGSRITSDSGNTIQLVGITADDGTDSAPQGTFVQVDGCSVVEQFNGVEGSAVAESGSTIQGFHYLRNNDDTEFRHYYEFSNVNLRLYSAPPSLAGIGHASHNVSGLIRDSTLRSELVVEFKGACDAPSDCADLWSYTINNRIVADHNFESARVYKMDTSTNVYSRGNLYENGIIDDTRTNGLWYSVNDRYTNCGNYNANNTACFFSNNSDSNTTEVYARGFTFINPLPAGRMFLLGSGTLFDFQGRIEGAMNTSIPNELLRITDLAGTTNDPAMVLIDLESDTDLGKDLDTIDSAADVDTSYIRIRLGTEQVLYRGDGTRVPVTGNDTVAVRKTLDTTWNRSPGSLVLSSADMDTGDEACAPLICLDIADGVGDGLDADDCTTDHPDGDTFMPICLGLSPPVVPGITGQEF